MPTRVTMEKDDRSALDAFLWGEVLLFWLLGAALALFVAYPSLRPSYGGDEARLVLQTIVMLAGAAVAVLAGVRFSVEGRRIDLLLASGFFVGAASTLCFSISPVLGGHGIGRSEAWSGVVGRLLAWMLIAAAPFAHGRVRERRRMLGDALVALAFVAHPSAYRHTGAGA